jgi:Uma2 family endonuclease
MTTTIQLPAPPEIEYPDSDGMPMAENTLQFKWIVVFKEGLETVFRYDPNVFVAGDLLWYAVQGDPTKRMAPDTMVAFGRPKGRRGSYKKWVGGGIAPQVVFEILSPGNRPAAMGDKFDFYQRHGVDEYYIYDPDDGELTGYLRDGAILKEIPDMVGYVSPRLNIRFEPGEGPDNLTIIGPDGEPFRTFQEIIDQRDAERRRADEADRQRIEADRQRIEAERQTAEAERQTAEAVEVAEAARRQAEAEGRRADQLAAKLRELGIEPE